MIRERNQYPKLMTPAGIAIWPALDAPDYKFKEDGEYHARLRFSPDAEGLAEIIGQAEAIRDEAYDAKKAQLTKEKKGALLKELNKAPVVTEEIDSETGDPTGFVILRAKLTAKVNIKNGPKAGTSFDKKPDVFDARGKQLKHPPRVGSGSTLKLAITPMDYFMAKGATVGISFELNAAQIIKLIVGGQREASDYGFGEEEGDSIEDGEPTGGFNDEGSGFTGEPEGDRDF